MEQSRLGRIEVAGGTADLRLAGQRLDYDASLRSNGGQVSAAGDGTPGAALPVYRVRQGRLTAVDLGTLLGRPGLRTDLNATFSAEITGTRSDSLGATLGVVLLPSRVNQAELTGGSLDASVDGKRVTATLRAEGPDAKARHRCAASRRGPAPRSRPTVRSAPSTWPAGPAAPTPTADSRAGST